MTIPATAPPAPGPVRWLNNQPYLLLSLTSLFWAGNVVIGRFAAGQIPPVTLSFIRWLGAFLIVLPFALRTCPDHRSAASPLMVGCRQRVSPSTTQFLRGVHTPRPLNGC
jgi:hypothetical protein